jgi:4-amino-4-deoxy-L-arabinose transferase-like glycosyltransferase
VSATALPARLGLDVRGRSRSLIRGRTDDPAWVRPSLLGLLAATALLYLASLGASGWANGFYSAAVQAGSTSWKAFFFGSFDASNFITVDKPPASLWVMDLSARVFGVNAWSILAPQALEGVAAVGLLYLTVRRRFGAAAGLIAGAVLALTPVATLMFRFDNPDALLTLLLVAAAYALTRAVEAASTRWLLLVGALIGAAFLTKMLQALVVVPGFALVYLVAAPTGLRRRIVQLLAAGAALVLAAGWWVAIVELWPASSRPYIGGSQTNSVLELIFGYNGFGRLTGNETGSVGGGGIGGGAGNWGPTGITRLFGAEMGTQISWLLPAALLALVVLLAAWWRAPRTDGRRAAILLWGSWLVVTGLVFSLAQGIIHPYYTVALAPAIGALVAIGAVSAWESRTRLAVRGVAAAALAGTGVWAFLLLRKTPTWHPSLRIAVLVAALLLAVALVAGRRLLPVALAALAVALAAPAAYSLQTASTPHTGAIPSAGPSGASGLGGPGGPNRRAFGNGGRGGFFGQQGAPGGTGNGSLKQMPGLGTGRGGFGGGPPGGGRGGLGGLLDASAPSAALVTLLDANAKDYTWVAATVGANSAAGFQLATGDPVMAIGGFNGTDPTPTLAQFQQLVAAGKVHYFIAGGRGGQRGGNGSIASWVQSHFSTRTVGGTSVYDLTAPTS